MKSYASIDRIEGKFVVCEVELISVEERSAEEYMPFVAISQGMVVVYFAYTFIKGRIDKHNSLKSVKS